MLLSLDPRSPGLSVISGSAGLGGLLTFSLAVVLARPGWIGPALGALVVSSAAHLLVLGATGLVTAGLAGVALLLAGEMAQWSIDARARGRYDTAVHVSRAVGVAVLELRGLVVVLLGGAAAALPISGGIELALIATTAAVGLFGLTAVVAARTR